MSARDKNPLVLANDFRVSLMYKVTVYYTVKPKPTHKLKLNTCSCF